MNRIYNLVFSSHAGDVVAVGENARRRGTGSRSPWKAAMVFDVRALFALLGLVLLALLLLASLWLSWETSGVGLALAAVDKKRAVLAKIESSYGIDPTPAGATDAIIARITGWRPQEVVYAARDDIALPALGRFESKTSAQRAEVDLEVEVSGAAAAGTAPPYGPLLRACGLSETIVALTSVTYAPISSAFESVAQYINVDGMMQKLLGCRGSVALVFRNDEIPFHRFRFAALYALPTDTALPALTLTAHQAPKPMNRTNTTTTSLHGYTVGIQELDVDLGVEFSYVDFPGGSQQVFITNRKPTGRIVIEYPTIAQKDFHTLVTSGAVGALSVAHTGGAAGKIMTLSCPQTRLTNPRPGAVKGIRTLELGLEFAPSVALNNELSIAYT